MAARAGLQLRERLVGYTRLALALVCVAWLLSRLPRYSQVDLFILVPIVAFIGLSAWHGRLLRAVTIHSRAIDFYDRGLARLGNTWQGAGATGEQFLESDHLGARDLDLFGPASLFELLCTARTRAGEEILARWLLTAALPDEVRARQGAVTDLTPRVDFRERLFTVGEDVKLGVRPAKLVQWGEADPLMLPAGVLRIVAPLVGAVWVLSMIAWFRWSVPGLLPLAATVINLIVHYRYRLPVAQAAHAAEEAGRDLLLLAESLRAFETEPFTSPLLVGLQSRLQEKGQPSQAVASLARLVEYLESAHNLFVRILDFAVFYRLQFVLAVERWRRRHGSSLRLWLETLGELEALASLGSYAYENPENAFPELVEGGPCFVAEGLAHPLIARERAVANDVRLDLDHQLILVSGPNMAGKSTFLRGIGVNAVLAQCGAPVRAAKLKLSPLVVTASICVLDSLAGGVSRFYAEIQRLKQIMDLAHGSVPVLFLLDELLSGTNSHDRLIGTRSIVVRLVELGAIGLVTTHDLALTAIPDEIGARALNCHFQDHLEAGGLGFDYKLYPGVVKTSNALPLMRSIGLEV
jgi:MutS domain V